MRGPAARQLHGVFCVAREESLSAEVLQAARAWFDVSAPDGGVENAGRYVILEDAPRVEWLGRPGRKHERLAQKARKRSARTLRRNAQAARRWFRAGAAGPENAHLWRRLERAKRLVALAVEQQGRAVRRCALPVWQPPELLGHRPDVIIKDEVTP